MYLKQQASVAVDHNVIHSIAEMQEAFSYSFSRGVAVERFFSKKEPYNTVVESAGKLASAQVSCSLK